MTNKALKLLEFQKNIITADDVKTLAFRTVNDLYGIIDADQALFWSKGSLERPKFLAVSGNVVLDNDTPFAQWLRDIIRKSEKNLKDAPVTEVPVSSLLDEDRAKAEEFGTAHIVIVAFDSTSESPDKTGGSGAGLVLLRQTPLNEPEKTLLEEIRPVLRRATEFHQAKKNWPNMPFGRKGWRARKLVFTVIILTVLFLPVPLTITAPVEVVAKNPEIITSPLTSLIEDVKIDPGERVDPGQTLLILDREEFLAEEKQLLREIETAGIRLSRLKRQALRDPIKKREILVLEAEIEKLEIRLDYVRFRLERSVLTSGRSGIAVFPDKSALLGKPVKSGQALMRIADPDKSELLIMVPVKNMLPPRSGIRPAAMKTA